MSLSGRQSGWDMIRELARDGGRSLDSIGMPLIARGGRQYPALNLYDAPDRFIVTAELPGLTAEDFELTITGDAVTLRGARLRDVQVPDEAYRRQERVFGTWSRTVSLPGKADVDGVTASLSLGVLTIVIMKAEPRRPRHIAVTMVAT